MPTFFIHIAERFRTSLRFRLWVVGLLLSSLLYLLGWVVLNRLGWETVLYQGELGPFGEVKLGVAPFLWWFRGALLSIWSISLSVYFLFLHPDSAYQQANSIFCRFREHHTYRNAFLRSLATSAPFRSVVKQGVFLSVLVINGFSRVSTVDFALGFAAWLILVFLLLLLLRFDPSPTYEEFQSDWDLLVGEFWKNVKKGGGLYAITTVVTVSLVQGVKLYLHKEGLAFQRENLEFKKEFSQEKLNFKRERLGLDILKEQNESKRLDRDLIHEQNRAEELKSKGPFGLW